MPASTYSFSPVTTADLARLRRWLIKPEVARWWGDPRDNFRARRAYAKAGFVEAAQVETETGPATLMIYEPGCSQAPTSRPAPPTPARRQGLADRGRAEAPKRGLCRRSWRRGPFIVPNQLDTAFFG